MNVRNTNRWVMEFWDFGHNHLIRIITVLITKLFGLCKNNSNFCSENKHTGRYFTEQHNAVSSSEEMADLLNDECISCTGWVDGLFPVLTCVTYHKSFNNLLSSTPSYLRMIKRQRRIRSYGFGGAIATHERFTARSRVILTGSLQMFSSISGRAPVLRGVRATVWRPQTLPSPWKSEIKPRKSSRAVSEVDSGSARIPRGPCLGRKQPESNRSSVGKVQGGTMGRDRLGGGTLRTSNRIDSRAGKAVKRQSSRIPEDPFRCTFRQIRLNEIIPEMPDPWKIDIEMSVRKLGLLFIIFSVDTTTLPDLGEFSGFLPAHAGAHLLDCRLVECQEKKGVRSPQFSWKTALYFPGSFSPLNTSAEELLYHIIFKNRGLHHSVSISSSLERIT